MELSNSLVKNGKSLISTLTFSSGAVTSLSHAASNHDKEEIIEGGLQFVQSLLWFIEKHPALLTGFTFVTTNFFDYTISKSKFTTFLKAASFVGLTACSVDMLIDGRGILRCHHFLKRHNHNSSLSLVNRIKQTEGLKKQKLYEKLQYQLGIDLKETMPSQDKLQRLALQRNIKVLCSDYLELSKEEQNSLLSKSYLKYPLSKQKQLDWIYEKKRRLLNRKKALLTRCTGEPFVQKYLTPNLAKTSTDLSSVKERGAAEKLIELTNTQVRKTQLTHAIGLLAAAFTAASLIALIILSTGTFLVPLLGSLGTLLYLTQYTLSSELSCTLGWQFSFKNALYRGYLEPISPWMPSSIQKRIDSLRDQSLTPLPA